MDPDVPGDPSAAPAGDTTGDTTGEPPGGTAPTAGPDPPDDKERANVAAVGRRLHQRFDATAGPEEVDRALDEAIHRFDGSRIRAFVPILAERIATDSLRTGPGPDLRGPVAPDGLPDSI